MDENALEQTHLLREIWKEMKALGSNLGGRIDRTNERLDRTNERLDQTNQRLDALRIEVKGEIAQTNARLEIMDGHLGSMDGRLGRVEESLRDLADQQLILTRVVKNVVDRQDEAIDDLRERMVRVETKLSEDE